MQHLIQAQVYDRGVGQASDVKNPGASAQNRWAEATFVGRCSRIDAAR
jgi:hypothetical protein